MSLKVDDYSSEKMGDGMRIRERERARFRAICPACAMNTTRGREEGAS